MAYDPTVPPSLVTQGIGGTTGMRWFAHVWIDTIADVLTPGYISNAADIGMRAGDGFLYKDVNRGEWDQYSLIVDAVDPVTGAATIKYPEVPEEALPLVTEFDLETVHLVAYSGGRMVRGPLDALIEFEDSVTKTFDVDGDTESVDLETDFDNPLIYIDGEYQHPDSYTLVDGILSPVGTWPDGELAAWIGGTRLFISTLPEIYTADIVNFDESVTTAIEAQVPAIIIEQIVAGTNITLETTVDGELRINSTGGGGGGGDGTGFTEAEVIQIIKDTLVEGANISFVEDAETITIVAASGGGGGSGEDITFSSRAEAIATTISGSINTILVNHASTTLRYWADPAGTALTTAGGRKWSPAETPTPLHWGAAGNGVADDRAAIQACIDSFSLYDNNQALSLINSPVAVIDGRNKIYNIAGPIVMGNVTGGTGMIFNLKIQNMRIRAIAGTWSGTIAVGIPRRMFVIAWRMALDYTDQGAGLFNITIENVTLDGNFYAGGIYYENTNSCSLIHSRIVRMGKNTNGIETSVGNASANPTGWKSGNGAFTMLNCFIAGIEEESEVAFPIVGGPANGETQVTMNTIGILWQTNDARFTDIITARVSKAWHIDNCGALQFLDLHPWSKDFYLGPNTNNFMFSNCYFDHTRMILDGSFNHYFVGCHWPVGIADRGLELRATAANTTGKGLLLVGCRFKLVMQIFHTEVGGTWVSDYLKEYQMIGCEFDDGVAYPWFQRMGKNLLIEADGTTHIQRDDPQFGRSVVRGNSIALGAGRTVPGRSAIDLFNEGDAGATAYLEQTAGGGLSLINNQLGGDIWLGNLANGNPDSLIINELGGFIFKRGGNINGFLTVVGAGAKLGGNLDMSSSRITSLAAPTTSLQGANKQYVDTVASDERLKQNVEPLAGGRDVIMALMPVEFDWRHTDDQENRGHMAGLIAQDVERVNPDLVVNRGEAEIETVDGAETIENVKGIKQEAIMAHMILMMQQMQNEIDKLRGQLLS